MPKITGDVELYMGPKEVGGKDDLCQTIVTFIDGAKKSLLPPSRSLIVNRLLMRL